MNKRLILTLLLSLLLLVGCGRGQPEHPRLPDWQLDSDRLILSGLSSGGYMAHQLHLAWPEEVNKISLFASGPYGCARAGVADALNRCMYVNRGVPSAQASLEKIQQGAQEGLLGEVEAIKNSRVFIYRAQRDAVVLAPVTETLHTLYTQLEPTALEKVVGAGAGHGFPALTGNLCAANSRPYINACGFSGAAMSLDFLDGRVDAAVAAEPQGQLYPFGQRYYSGDSRGFAETGYYYVPPQCSEGSRECGLLVMLHGCDQSIAEVGNALIEQSGYLQQADLRDLVVLFPQARSSMANPKGCWDWWGYESSRYDTREGLQTQALRAMWQTLLDSAEE